MVTSETKWNGRNGERRLKIEESSYTNLFGTRYERKGYAVSYHRELKRYIRTKAGIFEALLSEYHKPSIVRRFSPEQHRASALDEIGYLIQRAEQLKQDGRNPREALDDELFRDLSHVFRDGVPELTYVTFRAPNSRNFDAHAEKIGNKWYFRAVYFLKGARSVQPVTELWLPESGGIIKFNDALFVPAETENGNGPYLARFDFNPSMERARVLLKDCNGDLCIDATTSGDTEGATYAVRIFEQSVLDLPLPIKTETPLDLSVPRARP